MNYVLSEETADRLKTLLNRNGVQGGGESGAYSSQQIALLKCGTLATTVHGENLYHATVQLLSATEVDWGTAGDVWLTARGTTLTANSYYLGYRGGNYVTALAGVTYDRPVFVCMTGPTGPAGPTLQVRNTASTVDYYGNSYPSFTNANVREIIFNDQTGVICPQSSGTTVLVSLTRASLTTSGIVNMDTQDFRGGPKNFWPGSFGATPLQVITRNGTYGSLGVGEYGTGTWTLFCSAASHNPTTPPANHGRLSITPSTGGATRASFSVDDGGGNIFSASSSGGLRWMGNTGVSATQTMGVCGSVQGGLVTAASGFSTTPPTSSADSSGSLGEVRYDTTYLYLKTALSNGWRRVLMSTF